MYTLQALWTQAREELNVTTLVCSNPSYRILKVELSRDGVTSFGPTVRDLTELQEPAIDWVKIAEGFGIPGVRGTTAEDLTREFPCRARASFHRDVAAVESKDHATQ